MSGAPVADLSRKGIVKVAYMIPDVHVAALEWAQRWGAGPFFVKMHHRLAPFPEPGWVFDHSSAFGRWGGVMVELLQIHEVRPAAAEHILLRPGFHHVTWFAPSLPEESRRLTDLGWPVVLAAGTASGTAFTFHDASADLGHLVLIYEQTPQAIETYRTVAAAAVDWDGTDPVRPWSS